VFGFIACDDDPDTAATRDHWRDTEPQSVLFHRGETVGAPA
jgi:hypothetical protein